MAADGRLPRRLARIGGRSIPVAATWGALGVTSLVVVAGDLAQAASMTDAAVLISFMLVNASLLWLARRQGRQTGLRPIADVIVPGTALLFCGGLFLHVGWLGMATALALTAMGFALGRAAAAGDRSTGRGK
jgi:amino acid transporter